MIYLRNNDLVVAGDFRYNMKEGISFRPTKGDSNEPFGKRQAVTRVPIPDESRAAGGPWRLGQYDNHNRSDTEQRS